MFKVLCLILVAVTLPVFAKNIFVAVTSMNPVKINAVRGAFENQFPKDEVIVCGFKTESDIPEQPIGYDVALKGTRNRVASLPSDITPEYIVSIENYIEPNFDNWSDRAVVLMRRADQETVSVTQTVNFPTEFADRAYALSKEVSTEGYSVTVGQAMKETFSEVNPQNWHLKFGGVSRQELIEEVVFKLLHSEEIEFLKSRISLHPDFPKRGVLFQDMSPLLNDPVAFQKTIDLYYERYKHKNIEAIVGLESRGFILGAALAYKLGIGFVPVRKPGKLPGGIHSVTYEKEYGTDTLSISQQALKPGQRVLIVDDLIATGGSALAAIKLVEQAGGNPVGFVSLLEIKELHGREKLGIPSFNLID